MSAPAGLVEAPRKDGAIEWVLDRPERRNAISPRALRWITARCGDLHGEIVVLRGRGAGFCAGFDLGALDEVLAEGIAMPDVVLADATAAMSRADATFIAAVHGFAIGAAVELCCACDLRIAADNATFRVPAAALGVVYHADGIARLRAAFGPAGASRLLLLGDTIAAREADAMGALCRCVAAESLDTTVDEIVGRLAGIDRESFAANRDFLRTLARDAGDDEARVAHEAARTRAYARLGAGRRR